MFCAWKFASTAKNRHSSFKWQHNGNIHVITNTCRCVFLVDGIRFRCTRTAESFAYTAINWTSNRSCNLRRRLAFLITANMYCKREARKWEVAFLATHMFVSSLLSEQQFHQSKLDRHLGAISALTNDREGGLSVVLDNTATSARGRWATCTLYAIWSDYEYLTEGYSKTRYKWTPPQQTFINGSSEL